MAIRPPIRPIYGLSAFTDKMPGKINAPKAAKGIAFNHRLTQARNDNFSTIKAGMTLGIIVTSAIPIIIKKIMTALPPRRYTHRKSLLKSYLLQSTIPHSIAILHCKVYELASQSQQ